MIVGDLAQTLIFLLKLAGQGELPLQLAKLLFQFRILFLKGGLAKQALEPFADPPSDRADRSLHGRNNRANKVLRRGDVSVALGNNNQNHQYDNGDNKQ